MFHQSSKQILPGIFIALLSITMPVHAVENFKISNFGGGHQIWFEAEDYDERNPDTEDYYQVVDAEGAFGQAITRAGGAGGMIRWTFDISAAGGKGGPWYFWGRVINPSNRSDFLIVEGDPGDPVIPTGPPFPGTGQAKEFSNDDDMIFEHNAGPPWAWDDPDHSGGHTKELQDGENTMYIFHRQGNATVFWDVFVWTDSNDYVPTDEDYQNAVPGTSGAGLAQALAPNPKDGALHETTSATLSWRPGQFAVSHDIYIGMNFDDVNEASRESAVFVQNMVENELAIGVAGQPFPEGLEPGATYYWRVDEVNDADPNSPWKGLVWSFMIRPLIAWNPVPANGAESIYPKQDLSWDIGMGAESHTVYFGESLEAVRDTTAGGVAVTDPAYDPGQMQPSTTYYWRVDESAGTQTHTGDVWSFTTDHFIVVDDFEDYSDSPGSEPFTVWVDGFLTAADGGNGSGGIIATNLEDGQVLLETADKHGGAQSVPFFYNNTGVSGFDGLPRLTYSQVERSWSTPQDWTVKGLQDLTIWYKGMARPGSLSYDAAMQTYTMTGAGSNVWSSADQFHFAYKELTGDGSITARVDSIPVAPHGDPRIGVMIRDTLDPGAKNAILFVEPDPRTRFTARLQDTGNTANSSILDGTPLPTWIRLTREGITVRAERSADGINWSPVTDDPTVSSTEVALALIDPVYVGLVVCSHAAQQFAEATFSNVSITGNMQPAGPFTNSKDIGITTNATEPLYVAINGIVVTNDDPAAVNATEWTQWSIDLSTVAGLNPAAVTKLAIGVGDPQTPQVGGTGVLLLDDIQIRRP